MEERSYKAVENTWPDSGQWDVVLTYEREDGTSLVAACRSLSAKGNARLIAKLLNEHETLTVGHVKDAATLVIAALDTLRARCDKDDLYRVDQALAAVVMIELRKEDEVRSPDLACPKCGAFALELHRKPGCVTA